jgi:pimeloyl-ACP methyl ester carboxylesterase
MMMDDHGDGWYLVPVSIFPTISFQQLLLLKDRQLTMPRRSLVAVLFVCMAMIQSKTLVHAWKDCQGGGVCPDYATCCPSDTPGIPACISTRHGKDPDDAGECCDNKTGCPYGFSCATAAINSSNTINTINTINHHHHYHDHHHHDQQLYCKINTEDPPQDLFHDQPRYDMCRIPSHEMTNLYGFPIPSLPASSPQLAYFSNMGDISQMTPNNISNIQKVLIMIHGSGRTAEDYFCVALSILPKHERDNVLVLAPKFLAPSDDDDDDNKDGKFLVWQDEETQDHPLSHSWRYGADALNAPVSSYETLDRLTDFLVQAAPLRFPKLKHIVIAGHSAGGQVTHRWALLSNGLVWNNPIGIGIRAIAANPRSYCYLDGRRILHNATNGETYFDLPSHHPHDYKECPGYDQWNWGLESGGDLDTPYKDRAMQETPRAEMAQRYATRNVVYLTGAYDVLPQKDHCATYELQGENRHERALNYFLGLKEYFPTTNGTTTTPTTTLEHALHTIPESPHDHFLM